MAKKATSKAAPARKASPKKPAAGSSSRAVANASSGGGKRTGGNQDAMGDAFIKLLQSPLVADLVAVAATAALAALAEHGFSSRGASGGGKRTGRAVKEAGKAAAAAIGRRLTTEIDEIREASKRTKSGAGA